MHRYPSLVPILPCNDLDASEAFYARLGFRREDGGAGGAYRMLTDSYDGRLHLAEAVPGWLIPGRNPLGLYLQRPEVDDLAAAFGPARIAGPEDKPWGMYEFALSDPDGALVRIGWPTRLRGAEGKAGSPSGFAPNRSMPQAGVTPVLACLDVRRSADWLRRAFGFAERLRVADHRIQLAVGDEAVVLAQAEAHGLLPGADAVMVRVVDVDSHQARAEALGARILQPPTDHAYGERQYVALDPDGRRWTFSQTIADVAPETWGGISSDQAGHDAGA